MSKWYERADGDGQRARRDAGQAANPTDNNIEQQIFHQNIQINHTESPMCYVEDIYHSRCGHWASQPQVYHQCARIDKDTASPLSRTDDSRSSSRTCYNRKTCGSRSEDSVCIRCVAATRSELHRGTCMSVYSQGGRTKVLQSQEFATRMEDGKKRSSRELAARTPRSPSGFFSWNVQR